MGSRAMRSAMTVVLLGAAACSESSLPKPVITSVTTTSAPDYSDEVITLIVEGENFGTGIVADAEGGEAAEIERASLTLAGLEGLTVLVEGTYLGPTRIEATLPADTLDPDTYDVTVRNPDETSDTAAAVVEVWGPPSQLSLVPPTPDPSIGGEGIVTVRVLDAGGEETLLRTNVTLGIVLDSPTAEAPVSITLVTGTGGGSITVTDTVVETVAVSFADADLDAAGLTMQAPANVQFQPAFVRLVGGTELQPTDDFFDTVIRIEDASGNLVGAAEEYIVSLDPSGGTCTGTFARIEGQTVFEVTIPQGESQSAVMRVECTAGGADVAVLLTEVSATELVEEPVLVEFDFTTP